MGNNASIRDGRSQINRRRALKAAADINDMAEGLSLAIRRDKDWSPPELEETELQIQGIGCPSGRPLRTRSISLRAEAPSFEKRQSRR